MSDSMSLVQFIRHSLVTLATVAFAAATGAGVAAATTVSFEADLTASRGVDGDFVAGTFDDGGGGTALSLDFEGMSVSTMGSTSVSGDLGSALLLTGKAATSGGAVGDLSVEWLAARGGGGAVTSSQASVFLRFEEVLAADANDDGSVGVGDFVILSNDFGRSGGAADFSGDGAVGTPDVVIISAQYGRTAQVFAATGAVTSVAGNSPVPTPEPTSAALYMVGGLIVSAALRRRRA